MLKPSTNIQVHIHLYLYTHLSDMVIIKATYKFPVQRASEQFLLLMSQEFMQDKKKDINDLNKS